jgi:hypothetical protein
LRWVEGVAAENTCSNETPHHPIGCFHTLVFHVIVCVDFGSVWYVVLQTSIVVFSGGRFIALVCVPSISDYHCIASGFSSVHCFGAPRCGPTSLQDAP